MPKNEPFLTLNQTVSWRSFQMVIPSSMPEAVTVETLLNTDTDHVADSFSDEVITIIRRVV
ncbi:MAG: hypothetical protein DMF62_11010 [Acidobacteria bacterium]|nr:MAG: hypothetical protein DMF62_11010 [Acidobacteriota bacterium]